MIDGVSRASRYPPGQLAYRIISGNVWYDARVVLEDQKVCHFSLSIRPISKLLLAIDKPGVPRLVIICISHLAMS